MHKHLSIQWKLTFISALLIALTCLGLTVAVNFSAFRMADVIEAQKVVPSYRMPGTFQADISHMVPAMTAEEFLGIKLSFGRQSLGYMMIAILLGSGMTYYATGKALKPLKKLTEDVGRITIDTISEPIVIADSSTEIVELSASFNAMAERLNDAYRLQKRFSADAAHELRTPLAVLQTKIDVFQKDDGHTKEEYDGLISTLQKQILRLRNLAQSLLEMTGMPDPSQWTEFELGELLEDVTAELTPIARERQIVLRLQCEDCPVRGNVDQLYRVFFNLMENGIKYNQPGGAVTVTAQRTQDNRTRVTISDTGVGIPDDRKAHIFEPFYRVDPSRTRKIGGAGLGLAMVESILKQHNGTVEVSDGDAGGTCFTVIW